MLFLLLNEIYDYTKELIESKCILPKFKIISSFNLNKSLRVKRFDVNTCQIHCMDRKNK